VPLSSSPRVAWTANFCNLAVNSLELLVCAEFVEAVNADLNRSGVVIGNTVDVFGVAHDRLRPLRCQLRFSNSDGDRVGPHRDEDETGSEKGPAGRGPGS
jgi:hypothetical protein